MARCRRAPAEKRHVAFARGRDDAFELTASARIALEFARDPRPILCDGFLARTVRAVRGNGLPSAVGRATDIPRSRRSRPIRITPLLGTSRMIRLGLPDAGTGFGGGGLTTAGCTTGLTTAECTGATGWTIAGCAIGGWTTVGGTTVRWTMAGCTGATGATGAG